MLDLICIAWDLILFKVVRSLTIMFKQGLREGNKVCLKCVQDGGERELRSILGGMRGVSDFATKHVLEEK